MHDVYKVSNRIQMNRSPRFCSPVVREVKFPLQAQSRPPAFEDNCKFVFRLNFRSSEDLEFCLNKMFLIFNTRKNVQQRCFFCSVEDLNSGLICARRAKKPLHYRSHQTEHRLKLRTMAFNSWTPSHIAKHNNHNTSNRRVKAKIKSIKKADLLRRPFFFFFNLGWDDWRLIYGGLRFAQQKWN